MECAVGNNIERGNLPRSLWRRETGDGLINKYHSYRRGFACQDKPKDFNDLQCRALKGLKTAPCLSLPINVISEYETVPIYSLEKAGDRLIAADEHGTIHVISRWFQNDYRWETNKPPVNVTRTQISEKTAVYTVKYINDKIFAGTGSGTLCILDATSLNLIRTYTCHEKSIKKVDSVTGDILVTCSRDNSINFHDLRIKTTNPVNRINDAHCVPSKDSSTNSRHHKAKAAVINCQSSSPSNSVTDIVFIDENNLISSGASDGLLKQWDFRVTYKHLKKYHPVEILEYPGKNNNKGYGSLKVWNSKLYASSVQFDIFQFDLNRMQYETSYTSPSPMSFYTRLDVSEDGQFLASGSEEQQVHIFKTKPFPDNDTKTSGPVHTLFHDGDQELGVCCPVFDPHDDLMVTTGGDSSVVMKWIPEIYLDNDFAKQDSISESLANKNPSIKSEFKYIHRDSRSHYYRGSPKKCPSGMRLDSLPNYVIDGLTLPHVVPKIKIKLRKRHVCPNDWFTSPDSSNRRKNAEETTPKSRSGRKRRKFSDDESSPKISKYFKLISLPHTISEH